MLFGWFAYDWTILLVLPTFFISLWAQLRVSSTFRQCSLIYVKSGLTGAEAARRILDANGLSHIAIDHVEGELTDHYDPKAGVIRLSDAVYGSSSAAAVGVAAHEAGHAVQYGEKYFPIRLRAAIIPTTRIGSMLAIPLFLIGLLFVSEIMMMIGIALYSLVALFQLITLPVEFNASDRAIRILEHSGSMNEEELMGARRVLSAAALTYVAALLTSLMTLLRLLILARGSGRRR